MIIVMIAISTVVLALCVYVALSRLRRQRTPSALRGDWWADFEGQFRAYAADGARQRRAGRRDDPARRRQQVDE
jgi:hypothetical protein